MKRHVLRLITLTVLIQMANGAGVEGDAPVQMGSRLELFGDDFLIERMSGVSLRLHPPRMAEKVMTFDQPWEGPPSAYVTVFQDGDLYRMYYRGSSGPVAEGKAWEVTCYAESRDGIQWTRPALGLSNSAVPKATILSGWEKGLTTLRPLGIPGPVCLLRSDIRRWGDQPALENGNGP